MTYARNRILFISLFLFILLPFSFSQEAKKAAGKSKKEVNQVDELGRKQGTWQFYSYDGTLIYQVEYVNDKKHGLATRYHSSSGTVLEEANYFDGVRDGECKKYFATGQISAEGSYKAGRKEGTWISYYSVNGEKKSEGNYSKGKKTGEWKFYTARGTLMAKGEFKNDNKDGAWEYYDADGNVTATKKYINGAEVGAAPPEKQSKSTKTPVKKK